MDKKSYSPTGKDASRLVQALTAIQTFDREPNRVFLILFIKFDRF